MPDRVPFPTDLIPYYWYPEFDLISIRQAFFKYLDETVKITITEPVPAAGAGTYLDGGEEFTFGFEVDNGKKTVASIIPGKAIKLVNVAYQVWVQDPEVAQLIVPNRPPRAYSTRDYSSLLDVGTQVDSMILRHSYADDERTLDPGEIETITGLKGIAKDSDSDKQTKIRVRIIASPSYSFLFPSQLESREIGSTGLHVRGS